MVLHDYSCLAHGIFESDTGKCPHGCSQSFVEKVFLQAPGMKSDRTKGIDTNLANLAKDFGMTNMSNIHGAVGQADPGSARRVQQAADMQQMFAPSWGDVARGAENTSAIPQALAAHRAMPDNALAQVRDTLTAPKPMPVATFGTAQDIAKAST